MDVIDSSSLPTPAQCSPSHMSVYCIVYSYTNKWCNKITFGTDFNLHLAHKNRKVIVDISNIIVTIILNISKQSFVFSWNQISHPNGNSLAVHRVR